MGMAVLKIAALPQLQLQARLKILLYPAAGFDWKVPLSLLRLSLQFNLPKPGLCIYVDYSCQLAAKLEQAWAAGDSLNWGPGIRIEQVLVVQPPENWIASLRSRGRHAPQGGSVTSDCWYALDLRLASHSLPVLYIPADAVAFVSEIMTPLEVKPAYVATVTDGCREGGNWCCLSKKKGPFFQGLQQAGILPEYWLTDHGDLDFPALAQVNAGVYGRGESKLMRVQ